jgi:hypothetical protein
MAPEVKTVKNSKLPKLSENCFEPVGKGGWPSISIWINIIPLGSYDYITSMDWLEKHHVVLDCYNKTITCLDDEGHQGKIQVIPRLVVVK